jgi:hypothetical protein
MRGVAGAALRRRQAFERERRLIGEFDRKPEAPAHGLDVAAQGRDQEIAALLKLAIEAWRMVARRTGRSRGWTGAPTRSLGRCSVLNLCDGLRSDKRDRRQR